jgi:hypothetical protein
MCSPANLDACNDDERSAIQNLHERPLNELISLEEEAHDLVQQAGIDHDEEVLRIHTELERAEASYIERIAAIAHDFQYKYLQQVIFQKKRDIPAEEL